MTIPTWVLLAFATWTLLLLVATVGVYRWYRILTGRVAIRNFRYDAVEGHPDWYRRGMRAHGNCIENLPVYGAIVLVLFILGLDSRSLDVAALVLIVARVCQSLVHVSFVETNRTTLIRFLFFLTQVFAMFWMIATIIVAAV